MAPKKRRVRPGDAEHRGRVTLPRDPSHLPKASEPTFGERSWGPKTERAVPAPSSRYTPPAKSVRLRPDWHKTVGALILVLGIAVAILNEVMLLGASVTLLPGGHSELYLVLGIVIAGYGTWWFGWFDRED